MNIFFKTNIRKKVKDDLEIIQTVIDIKMNEITALKEVLDSERKKWIAQQALDDKQAKLLQKKVSETKGVLNAVMKKSASSVPPRPLWKLDEPGADIRFNEQNASSYNVIKSYVFNNFPQKWQTPFPNQQAFKNAVSIEVANKVWPEAKKYFHEKNLYETAVLDNKNLKKEQDDAKEDYQTACKAELTHFSDMHSRSNQALEADDTLRTKIKKLTRVTVLLIKSEAALWNALIDNGSTVPTDVYVNILCELMSCEKDLLPLALINEFKEGVGMINAERLQLANQGVNHLNLSTLSTLLVLGLILYQYDNNEFTYQKLIAAFIMLFSVYCISHSLQNNVNRLSYKIFSILNDIQKVTLQFKNLLNSLEDMSDTTSKETVSWLKQTRSQAELAVKLIDQHLTIGNSNFAFFSQNANAAMRGMGCHAQNAADTLGDAIKKTGKTIAQTPALQCKFM